MFGRLNIFKDNAVLRKPDGSPLGGPLGGVPLKINVQVLDEQPTGHVLSGAECRQQSTDFLEAFEGVAMTAVQDDVERKILTTELKKVLELMRRNKRELSAQGSKAKDAWIAIAERVLQEVELNTESKELLEVLLERVLDDAPDTAMQTQENKEETIDSELENKLLEATAEGEDFYLAYEERVNEKLKGMRTDEDVKKAGEFVKKVEGVLGDWSTLIACYEDDGERSDKLLTDMCELRKIAESIMEELTAWKDAWEVAQNKKRNENVKVVNNIFKGQLKAALGTEFDERYVPKGMHPNLFLENLAETIKTKGGLGAEIFQEISVAKEQGGYYGAVKKERLDELKLEIVDLLEGVRASKNEMKKEGRGQNTLERGIDYIERTKNARIEKIGKGEKVGAIGAREINVEGLAEQDVAQIAAGIKGANDQILAAKREVVPVIESAEVAKWVGEFGKALGRIKQLTLEEADEMYDPAQVVESFKGDYAQRLSSFLHSHEHDSVDAFSEEEKIQFEWAKEAVKNINDENSPLEVVIINGNTYKMKKTALTPAEQETKKTDNPKVEKKNPLTELNEIATQVREKIDYIAKKDLESFAATEVFPDDIRKVINVFLQQGGLPVGENEVAVDSQAREDFAKFEKLIRQINEKNDEKRFVVYNDKTYEINGVSEKNQEVADDGYDIENRESFGIILDLAHDFRDKLVGALTQDDEWRKYRKEYQENFIAGELKSFLGELLEQESIAIDKEKEFFIKKVLKSLAGA